MIVLAGERIGEEKAAPAVERSGLQCDELLEDAGRGEVLLLAEVNSGKAIECVGAMRIHRGGGAIFRGGHVELILVHGLRSFGHGVPEARGGQRIFDDLRLVSVLLCLGEVIDGVGEVLLLHAQESHACEDAAVVGLRCERVH